MVRSTIWFLSFPSCFVYRHLLARLGVYHWSLSIQDRWLPTQVNLCINVLVLHAVRFALTSFADIFAYQRMFNPNRQHCNDVLPQQTRWYGFSEGFAKEHGKWLCSRVFELRSWQVEQSILDQFQIIHPRKIPEWFLMPGGNKWTSAMAKFRKASAFCSLMGGIQLC